MSEDLNRLRLDARILSSVACRSNALAITFSPNRLKQLIFVSTSDRQW
jgi:hypothetical protein